MWNGKLPYLLETMYSINIFIFIIRISISNYAAAPRIFPLRALYNDNFVEAGRKKYYK